MSSDPPAAERAAFRVGAGLLGFGLGGLADGLVLHQLLQWHHLVARPVPPDTLEALRTNVFWDGVFHVATTVVLVVGFVVLQRSWRRGERAAGDGRAVGGWVLIGWGVFHVVDLLVFHVLLDLHDIRMGVADPALYNGIWGAAGLVLVALGLLLLRRRPAPSRGSSEPDRRRVSSR